MAFMEQHLTTEHAAQLLRAGELSDAEAICRQLLKRDKRNLDAIQLRGAIALTRRDYAEALKHYQRCLSIRPREPQFQFLLGKVLALDGRYGEAIKKLDKTLALQPDHVHAAEYKAMVHQWDGDYDAATTVLAPYISAGRENAGMAEVQARIDIHDKRYREAAALAERHLAAEELDPATRHRLGHVAGSAWEKLGEYAKSFEAHTRANQAVAIPFDRGEYTKLIDGVIDVFSKRFIADRSRHGNRSELPVFIAGMPRSGTTLVEQIIDAHPDAHGAGEAREIDQTAENLQRVLESSEPWPRSATDLDPQDITRLAGQYLDTARRTARNARRVVNKSLENYRTLGLIAVLFPRATIIHCHRDPRDTCISCYMSGILPRPHPYISDLGDLGFAYRQYRRLIEHWKQALPMQILDVGYEALVDDLDGQARRIIDFCGLPWNDRCLEFHASGRTVRTASYEQVRQPIYRSSIGRYKGFEKHIRPLLEALE
ncbi:MAG: sulfotransferase [Phycisphaerales bacterium]